MRKSWLAAGLLFVPTVASAHIHMTSPKSRTDAPTGDQKDQHCGVTGYVRADHPDRISSFLPGATITVTWAETINHPGWYRISFQPAGETFSIPLPQNGTAVDAQGQVIPSNMPETDQTGMVDAATGAMILKDRIPDGTLTTDITLPNMECANCTLQFTQFMIDKSPYTTDLASDDIYFNCADIVLTANPQPPATPDAGTNPDPTDPGTGENGNTTTGGCATGGGLAGLPVGLALLGLVAARRRRTLRA